MTARLELIINQIDGSTRTGRILKENLRRIEDYINSLARTTTSSIQTITNESTLSTLEGFNKHDSFDATDGQTVFTLSEEPADSEAVKMFVNYAGLTLNEHYTVSGSTVTFDPVAAGFSLESSNEFGQPDRVDIYYSV